MSIRLRLTLLYSGLMTIGLVLFSLLLYSVLRFTFTQTVDATLIQVSDRVAKYYKITSKIPALDTMSDRTTFVQVRVGDQSAASSNFQEQFPLPAEAKSGHPWFSNELDSSGTPYRLFTLPVIVGNRLMFYVQVAHSLTLVEMTANGLRPLLALGTIIFVGVAALGAWFLAGRAVRPIQGVARAAKAVGDSADLSLRVPYQGPDDEVGSLVKTFNGMLDQLQALYGRLAASVDTQQRFVADASHELRTPLTILRGNIDYLQRAGVFDAEALADMGAEAERMTRLVEELLTLARTDAGQTPDLLPVALGALVAEACQKAQALPHTAEFVIDLPSALDRVTVLGQTEWLRRAVLILIDNAFKYTPGGSVTLRAGRQGDGVVIQVRDTGVGIAPEDLPHIFERFYRADRARARGGTGLGLAIAEWVAGLHNGHLTVESELGQGSTFSLWLPLHRG